MPGMTGMELCREKRSFAQSIPIFFCCGGVAEPHKAAAVGAGAQGYISKHFDNGETRFYLAGCIEELEEVIR